MTGDATTLGKTRVVVSFPNSQKNWVYSCFLGDMVEATSPDTWITAGESSPEDAADIFVEVLEGIKPMPLNAGDIKWSAAATLPADAPWLYCDGGLYLRVDYPALFAAIGTNYNTGGEDGAHFRVPDLRGETIVGVDGGRGKLTAGWAGGLGGQGGEQNHTLVTSETPSHSHSDTGHAHTESTAFPAVGAALLGVPIPSAVPLPGVTGIAFASLTSTGGDGAHNNVQPSIALFAYIYTEI